MISVESSEMEEEITTKIWLLSIPFPLYKEDIAMKNQLIYLVYCKEKHFDGIRGVSLWFSWSGKPDNCVPELTISYFVNDNESNYCIIIML